MDVPAQVIPGTVPRCRTGDLRAIPEHRRVIGPDSRTGAIGVGDGIRKKSPDRSRGTMGGGIGGLPCQLVDEGHGAAQPGDLSNGGIPVCLSPVGSSEIVIPTA